MILSEFGKIAEEEWHKSFEIRKELILDEFIIMPYHLHAIIIIDKTNDASRYSEEPEFHRKPKSISSFVAGYKTGVTGKIDDFIDFHKLPIEKFNRNNRFWQPNYHDHIIRNEKEYWRIKNYIKNNLKNWKDDDCWE